MKSDIDRLMDDAGLDGLVVLGPSQHNPYLAYFVGSVHLTDAVLVKTRQAQPVLFHRSMERGEAELTGLPHRLVDAFDWMQYLERADDDVTRARALRTADMLGSCQIQGRVALYGRLDLSYSLPFMEHLSGALPGVEWVFEQNWGTVLDLARMTKDADELGRIRQTGEVTIDVVEEIADFLTHQRARDGLLVDKEGQPITVGQVKFRIRGLLAERGAELPSGIIFSVGRDAGLPHSVGDDDQPLPMGETIVFDIYPAHAGGGYYYDFTRTWCLGHASDEAQAIYQDVLEIYRRFGSSFKVGDASHIYQDQVCQAFEDLGHPSQLSDMKASSGYVHGLGHGLGLAVHEPPGFNIDGTNSYPIAPGMVFTFEPGLYYPEKGIGVRIEDTLVVDADGTIHPVVTYPTDLVLPVAGS